MKIQLKYGFTLLLFSMFLSNLSVVQAQDANPMDDVSKSKGDLIVASMEGHVFKPAKVEPTDEHMNQLKLPEGFVITKYADKLGSPRMLAVNSNGHVYVTDRENGLVRLLRDTNGDSKADENKIVARRDQMHGIAIHNNKMYLITVKEVFTADIKNDGTLSELKMIMKDLPDGGQHANRTLAFGPEGMMYISVGSTCNACNETSEESATIIQAKADGTGRKVYAKGLRNTIGFAWHPQTKEMFGMDHGIDWLGDDSQEEEVNKIEKDADYGWPYVFEDGKPNPGDEPPQGMTYKEYASKTKFPLLTYKAHSAPMAMAFYDGNQFPDTYKNDAYIALHGSWNRAEPSGYKIVRLTFKDGKPSAFEDFLTGFLVDENQGQFGRVVGLAVHTDGSLLVSDDSNGVIYRISYERK